MTAVGHFRTFGQVVSNVRFGSKPDIGEAEKNACFTPKSEH